MFVRKERGKKTKRSSEKGVGWGGQGDCFSKDSFMTDNDSIDFEWRDVYVFKA